MATKMIASASLMRPAVNVGKTSSRFGGVQIKRANHSARVSVARKTLRTSASVGLYFTTTTGHTEEVADAIKENLGDAVTDPIDASDVEAADLAAYDSLIIGSPTWNTGADTARSGTAWDELLEDVKGMDMSGKKVAVFGCGDSVAYSDYFCDALEEVHSAFSEAGATMVGAWPTESYEFECSKSVVGGEPLSSGEADKMLGLAIDEENQSDLTEDRAFQWCAQLKTEMAL